jgi:sugar lactone lactonase YvrE
VKNATISFIAAAIFLFASNCSSAQTAALHILSDKISGSEGIALCPDGKLFAVENGSGKIFQIIDDENVSLFSEGHERAAGIACGPNGDIFVADYGAGTVSVVSADGKSKKTLAVGFKTPNGIAVSPDGTIYMSDSTSGIVYEMSADGKTERLLDGVSFANGLLISPDGKMLYVAQTTAGKIIVAPLDGPNRGKKATFASKLKMADGITGTGDGAIYVCLFSSGEIAKAVKGADPEIIASGLQTPATPVVKDGFLYITSLTGTGIYKILLPKEK